MTELNWPDFSAETLVQAILDFRKRERRFGGLKKVGVELGKRLATAAVGIPAAIFIINYGQWVFGLTILLLSMVAWHEYVRMVENIALKPSYGLGMAIIIAILLAAWLKTPAILTGVLVFAVLVMLAATVFRYGEFSLNDAAVTLLGVLYVGLPFSHLLLLRYLDTGGWLQQDITPIGAWYLWLAFWVHGRVTVLLIL